MSKELNEANFSFRPIVILVELNIGVLHISVIPVTFYYNYDQLPFHVDR